jgi:hypothetical protein
MINQNKKPTDLCFEVFFSFLFLAAQSFTLPIFLKGGFIEKWISK